jgi:hypothetical protein
MEKKTRKISKLTIQSLVAGVSILFFVQCTEDKTKKYTSEDSSLPVAEVVKEMTEETKTENSFDTLNIVKSEKQIREATEQTQVVDKKKVENVKPEFKAINPQVKKADNPVVQVASQEELQMDVSGKTEEIMVAVKKPKEEDILAKEVEILFEKVRVLEEKVKIIFEKLKLFSEEVKTRVSVEEVAVLKVEENLNLDKGEETLAEEAMVFKYPIHVLAGGISTYKGWTGYGLQGSYAYRINKYFSLGVQGNAFFKDGKYKGDRSLYIGARANFHILPLFVNSKFDLYAGGTAGGYHDNNKTVFKAMAYLGFAYDFSKHWGLFAEAGNIGTLGLRLKF